jgi:TPR repeat protein
MMRMKSDEKRGLELLQRACDGGLSAGCYNLGQHFAKGGPADIDRAIAFYRKACDAQNWPACTNLAMVLLVNNRDERSEAQGLQQRSCEHGDWNACSSFLELASDEKHAPVLARLLSACEKDAEACAILGTYHTGVLFTPARPELTARDAKRGMDFLTRACNANNADGCFGLGAAYLYGVISVDLPRAAALFQRACDSKKQPAACHMLGVMYSTGHGVAAVDHARAATLIHQACDENFFVSCQWLRQFTP